MKQIYSDKMEQNKEKITWPFYRVVLDSKQLMSVFTNIYQSGLDSVRITHIL